MIRWWRRPRLPPVLALLEAAVVVLAITIFVVLGREYAAAPLVAVDEGGLALTRTLRGPAMDSVFDSVTNLGASWLWFIWLPAVVALVLLRRLPSALAVTVVALGVYTCNDVLKGIYQRARPTELEGVVGVQMYSFPSGHAMAAGAVYSILAFVAWRELRGRARWAAIAACAVLAIGVALSRVYLGVHYPTDVTAGLLAGALWTDLVILAWRMAARLGASPTILRSRTRLPG